MLVACWSPKGGTGTTVVATSLALLLARSAPSGALIADLAGDVPAVLGIPEPSGPGLADWLEADADVATDALARLEIPAHPPLGLLALGGVVRPACASSSARGEVLAAALAADVRPVVVDCGAGSEGAGRALAAAATVSLIVVRPCYLGLRRALAAPLRATGAVVVDDGRGSLTAEDVAAVLGIPVAATVPLDPAVARAVDAGLLASRLPRPLSRALRRALPDMAVPTAVPAAR